MPYIKQTDYDKLVEFIDKAAEYMRREDVCMATFERGEREPHYAPNGSQWVPAYPDRIEHPAMGAHVAPDGHTNRLNVYKGDAVGSPVQYLFRAQEVLSGAYQPQTTEARA